MRDVSGRGCRRSASCCSLGAGLDEDRVVADVAQRQLEHAVRLQPEAGCSVTAAPKSYSGAPPVPTMNCWMPKASRRPDAVLRREPLVEMVVAGDRDVDAELVSRFHMSRIRDAGAAARAGREQRVVPVGERAARPRRRSISLLSSRSRRSQRYCSWPCETPTSLFSEMMCQLPEGVAVEARRRAGRRGRRNSRSTAARRATDIRGCRGSETCALDGAPIAARSNSGSRPRSR